YASSAALPLSLWSSSRSSPRSNLRTAMSNPPSPALTSSSRTDSEERGKIVELFVSVRRQPDDWKIATYELQKISGLHVATGGGGVQRRSAMHVYGYVLCDEMVNGELEHSCQHGPPPHQIKVCVTRKYNKRVWPQIIEIVGAKPKRSFR